MQAVEYIIQAKKLDALIENKRQEEQEIWTLVTSITQASDGMPHGTSDPDKMTGKVQKLIEARARTNAAIERYASTKQDIIKHLEMLPLKQYEVLYWLYVKKRDDRKAGQKWYYTWSEVAENLGCSEENIRKTRRRAIKNLQKILDSEQGLLEVE